MQLLRIATIVALTICVSCNKATKEDLAQTSMVRSFYDIAISRKEGGIPSGKDLERMKPYLSARLIKLIIDGQYAEELYGKRTKHEVPPLIEGSFLFSLFEGADRIIGTKRESLKSRTSYLVEFEYGTNDKDNKPTRWKDRAVLIQENGKWVIDEIEFLGDWDFATKGQISAILKDVIQTANATKQE